MADAPVVAVVSSESGVSTAQGMAVADLVKGATGARIVVASWALADPALLSLDAGMLGDPADLTPAMGRGIRALLEPEQAGD